MSGTSSSHPIIQMELDLIFKWIKKYLYTFYSSNIDVLHEAQSYDISLYFLIYVCVHYIYGKCKSNTKQINDVFSVHLIFFLDQAD